MDIIEQAKQNPTKKVTVIFRGNLEKKFEEFCNLVYSAPNISNIEFINICFEDEDLILLRRAFRSSCIDNITFTFCRLGTCLQCIQETRKIKELILNNCTLSEACIDALRKMVPFLRYLTCRTVNKGIEIVGLLKEKKHHQLKELRLMNVNIGFRDINDVFRHCILDNMEVLNLSCGEFSPYNSSMMAKHIPNSNIKSLIIHDARIDAIKMHGFIEMFTKNPDISLENLDISSNYINDRGFTELLRAILENKNRLKTIRVPCNHLITGNSTGPILQCLRSLPRLTTIEVSQTSIPKEDRKKINLLGRRKKSTTFQTMSTLCVAKYIHRASLPECYVSLLPKELLQRINLTLPALQ